MYTVRLTGGLALPASTPAMARKDSTMTSNADDLGGIIDLGDVVKGRRGAVAERIPALMSLLAKACNSGKAVALHGMAVIRSTFDTDDAFRNERQRVAAVIRAHFDALVADGTLPAGSRCSINWHPESGVPQVQLRP